MEEGFVVHIVDDDDAVRQSLAFLLSTAGVAVRVYDSAADFLAGLGEAQVGCLITDVRMPEVTGIQLLHALKERAIRIPAIVITGHGDIPLAVEAMKAGAFDFIEKPFEEEAILRAVRGAQERAQAQSAKTEDTSAVARRLATLSEREKQVLEGLISGAQNKIIAHELGISPRTVEVYRANLMAKMQAKSLSELIRMTLFARMSGTGEAAY
jgi:two-component system, LuxR family, response regulator FixJ